MLLNKPVPFIHQIIDVKYLVIFVSVILGGICLILPLVARDLVDVLSRRQDSSYHGLPMQGPCLGWDQNRLENDFPLNCFDSLTQAPQGCIVPVVGICKFKEYDQFYF